VRRGGRGGAANRCVHPLKCRLTHLFIHLLRLCRVSSPSVISY
jgi:hypothetical protein